MSDPLISYVPELPEWDRLTIVNGLAEFNRAHDFAGERSPLNVVARSAEGEVVGGLLGEVNWQWLFVSALWVDEGSRGVGVGSSLMKLAQDEAQRRGCLGIYLDTFSFQAKPFYERLGYTLFGELTGFPLAQTRYYFYKRLVKPVSEGGRP